MKKMNKSGEIIMEISDWKKLIVFDGLYDKHEFFEVIQCGT